MILQQVDVLVDKVLLTPWFEGEAVTVVEKVGDGVLLVGELVENGGVIGVSFPRRVVQLFLCGRAKDVGRCRCWLS